MASNKASGYDLDWIEEPPDDLKCLICLCVARDPRQHPGDDKNPCGKIFCLECITKYQRHRSTCPNCRQNLTLFSDVRSARAIKALKVKCDNETNGCDWTGELGFLETHLQTCDYTLVPCTNKCETNNKITKFLRTYLNNNLKDCPRRQYECPHCQETGEHQERTTTHLDTCPKVKIHCPNTDCQDMIARCDVETHHSMCFYESVSCKYTAVGCEEKPLRKDLTKHEKDSQLHLQLTIEQNLKLTQKIGELMQRVGELMQRVTVLEYRCILTPCNIRLTNYQKRKNNNDEFYSTPFYTSSMGYKMCLVVYANGWKEGAGTHVSVYICLMKGDHDDTLTWPFPGTITIELLNQLNDKNHRKMEIRFPANHESSQRVVVMERGFGSPEFISHVALDHNLWINNTQYLEDDTLVFRVSVEIPNRKPWLESTEYTIAFNS